MDSCINWPFDPKARYPRLPDGDRKYVHRFVFELCFGPIPKGMNVCHVCDNPRCVNPDHLFVGTQSDNLKDCVAKGRWKSPMPVHKNRGMHNGNAKLTEQDIPKIKLERSEGKLLREIANDFGVSRTVIGDIMRGKGWVHVT
jgi:hypothetical protein